MNLEWRPVVSGEIELINLLRHGIGQIIDLMLEAQPLEASTWLILIGLNLAKFA